MAVNNDNEMCWLPVHPTLITSHSKPWRGCYTEPSSRVELLLQGSDYNQKLFDDGTYQKTQGIVLQRYFNPNIPILKVSRVILVHRVLSIYFVERNISTNVKKMSASRTRRTCGNKPSPSLHTLYAWESCNVKIVFAIYKCVLRLMCLDRLWEWF